ncbi:hypothetical protein D3C81_1675280 [compost metagenome]
MDQIYGGGDGPAGSQQVIGDQHLLAGADSIGMHSQLILAVFQGIILFNGGGRQLAAFADGHKAYAQGISQRRSHHKASGFGSGNQVNLLLLDQFPQCVD